MNATLWLFATMAFLTVVTPGPTSLLALNNGARWGTAAALPGVLGAVLSDAVLITTVAAGLGGVLRHSAWAFELLRWCGVAYLAWLGWGLLRHPAPSPPANTRPVSPGCLAVLRRSFTVAVTNPKGYLFFAALLPSFLDPLRPLAPQYLGLTVLFCGIDGAVLCAYAATGALGARRLSRHQLGRHLNWFSGGALWLMAASLALWRRSSA